MFNNPGKMIVTVSKVLFWIEVVASLFVGFANSNLDIGGKLLFIIAVPLVAYISTLFLVGFGELIQSNKEINEKLKAEN